MCDALLRISGDLLSVNDVAEIIDVLSKTLNEVTEQLPSMILLHSITDLLKRLVNEREYIPMDELMRYTFPSRLKVVIKRLIQTNNISDDYRMMCFILCALLVCLFDFQWFGGDPQFLILLSALTHVELRLILDKPEMINVEDLISCATLGESFIQCIEEGDFLDDQQATVVGRNCQECVSYVCEYLIECRRDETVELQSNVEIVLYRLICSYLAIGGSDTINSSLIDDVLLALVDIANQRW
uniref:Neurochondrin n=1 Tax=Parascaris univalens TaxID=6257 RepID=A0A915BC25_PARUN